MLNGQTPLNAAGPVEYDKPAVKTELLLAVAAFKLVNLSGRIKNFLLAGVERMAGRANFNVQIFADR